LTKSLYSLKLATRQWFSKFSNTTLDHGFEQSKSNYSPFTRLQGTSYIALLVYVDGIIIFGNNANAIVQLSAYLNTQFYLKDLGPMKYILGFEIARTAAGISVCQ
jgi:hypothetical protein